MPPTVCWHSTWQILTWKKIFSTGKYTCVYLLRIGILPRKARGERVGKEIKDKKVPDVNV
jgi:hypothetical protein